MRASDEIDAVRLHTPGHRNVVTPVALRMSSAGTASVASRSRRGDSIHIESAAIPIGLSTAHAVVRRVTDSESRAGNAEFQ